MKSLRCFLAFVACASCAVPSARAQAPAQERTPILLDTDLGSDLGDGFALALILASPELDLRGVTTVSGDTNVRALMACRFLTMTGRRHTQVAAGAKPQAERTISPTGHYRYYYHPDVLFNRTTRPLKESAVEVLHARLKAQPGKITLVATGPLTNIARLLTEKPESAKWIRQIVFVESEGNVAADLQSAQAVLSASIPMTIIPKEAGRSLILSEAQLRRVFSPGTALTLQIQNLHELWEGDNASIPEALAVSLCLGDRFVKLQESPVQAGVAGLLQPKQGKANALVAGSIQAKEFLQWYVERLENCVAPADRPSKLVSQGNFPYRVQVAEDYDTDIERFWWMSGRAETKVLLPWSKRACRGTLTHDFDDLLGHTKAMYTAVIFNPVPGPPMGKNTRLSFRFWLKGTDTLRVAIYSLTNGYHRHLVLKGLPEGRWESATVDMTATRRPDGTGGPLSENERIDDIQFYAHHTAELLIDDVVLYDAAQPDEKRPFPKHIHFTAGFDTGTYGKHWLGDFEVVADKGAFWRAARSVASTDGGRPWIRLNLRGERPLGQTTRLSFRCLTNAAKISVALFHAKTKTREVVEVLTPRTDAWCDVDIEFKKARGSADEIHFLLSPGSEMFLDDVVLYEPGAGR